MPSKKDSTAAAAVVFVIPVSTEIFEMSSCFFMNPPRAVRAWGAASRGICVERLYAPARGVSTLAGLQTFGRCVENRILLRHRRTELDVVLFDLDIRHETLAVNRLTGRRGVARVGQPERSEERREG